MIGQNLSSIILVFALQLIAPAVFACDQDDAVEHIFDIEEDSQDGENNNNTASGKHPCLRAATDWALTVGEWCAYAALMNLHTIVALAEDTTMNATCPTPMLPHDHPPAAIMPPHAQDFNFGHGTYAPAQAWNLGSVVYPPAGY